MTKRKNKFKGHNNQKRKSRLRPPFFVNKNFQFDYVRKQMKMKTDGPTLNEMSSIDTTGNVGSEDMHQTSITRPKSTKNQVKDWFEDNRQIILSVAGAVVTALVLYIFGSLVHDHDIHLTEHDKDIEYLQKNDTKQDGEIEHLKSKTQELSTDVRLIEQRVELTSGNTDTSKQPSKK